MLITNLDIETEEKFIKYCLPDLHNFDFLINEEYEIELNFDLNELFEFSDNDEDESEDCIFHEGYKYVFIFLNNIFKKSIDHLEDLKKISFKCNSSSSEFEVKLLYHEILKNQKRIITYHFKHYSENNDDFYEYFEDNFDNYFNLTYFNTNIFFGYIYNQDNHKYSAFEHASFFEKVCDDLYNNDDFLLFMKSLIENKKDFIKYLFSMDGAEHYIDIYDSDKDEVIYEDNNLLVLVNEDVELTELKNE